MGRVVRPGRVPDAERDAWYARATALAFPSLYEGFGAPVLESMAAGCPVVLVSYGYNHGEPVRGVDADGFVDSLVDLKNQLLPSSASLSL